MLLLSNRNTSFVILLIFSRVFHRKTDPVTVEDENAGDNSVIPQVQGSSSETTVVQSSGIKRKGDPLESASTAPSAKYQRSGLESEEKWNSLDLLPYISSYVNWFMATHSYEKEIREKSLIRTPVSSNFKVSQKLDKYMQEGKKSKTLCWKNT